MHCCQKFNLQHHVAVCTISMPNGAHVNDCCQWNHVQQTHYLHPFDHRVQQTHLHASTKQDLFFNRIYSAPRIKDSMIKIYRYEPAQNPACPNANAHINMTIFQAYTCNPKYLRLNGSKLEKPSGFSPYS